MRYPSSRHQWGRPCHPETKRRVRLVRSVLRPVHKAALCSGTCKARPRSCLHTWTGIFLSCCICDRTNNWINPIFVIGHICDRHRS
jgi:hypothetical protein